MSRISQQRKRTECRRQGETEPKYHLNLCGAAGHAGGRLPSHCGQVASLRAANYDLPHKTNESQAKRWHRPSNWIVLIAADWQAKKSQIPVVHCEPADLVICSRCRSSLSSLASEQRTNAMAARSANTTDSGERSSEFNSIGCACLPIPTSPTCSTRMIDGQMGNKVSERKMPYTKRHICAHANTPRERTEPKQKRRRQLATAKCGIRDHFWGGKFEQITYCRRKFFDLLSSIIGRFDVYYGT